jgi:CubicO group peptidase (beta-lactamase class C family)
MKKLLRALALIIVLLGIVIGLYYTKLEVITGLAAKISASALFMTDRTQSSVESGDIGFFPVSLAKIEVDKKERSVTARLFGLKERKAVFRDGLGAVLLVEDSEKTPESNAPKRDKTATGLPFPYGDQAQKDTVFAEVDYSKLDQAVGNLFDPAGEKEKQTRSVLVVYKDQIVAEKYSEGFGPETPMLGWSMTKSITSTMYGILQYQGKIDIHTTTGLEEWQNDDRSKITYHNLLQMNSGLEWVEDYFAFNSDTTPMLYFSDDMGISQIDKDLVGEPDQSWYYSSGTTNLLAGPLLKSKFSNQQEYLDFWYSELIDKIGMHSAVIETDLSGTFIGSSYGWATTRDWAKFGLLYLKKGNWNGEQIFDPTWAEYVATPTNSSEGRYGAQFWLNAGGHYPDAPRDVYSCNGFQGQYVFIVPSRGLVIVRTGLAKEPDFDVNAMLRDVISCFPESS